MPTALPGASTDRCCLTKLLRFWHEAFLGTNDFYSARVPKRVLNALGFRC